MAQYVKRSYSRKPGVSAACIEETEVRLARQLSEQYKALVQLVNGPQFGEWLFYPIRDEKNLKKTFDDVVRNTEREWAVGLPTDFIAVAENGTGNVLCFRTGEVALYHQDHEAERPEKVFVDLAAFIENAEDFAT